MFCLCFLPPRTVGSGGEHSNEEFPEVHGDTEDFRQILNGNFWLGI